MNPQIHSRWGLMCPSCQKPLINPNQPWPQACATCGQRTHLKCLHRTQHWLVDLDTDINPGELATVCGKCHVHAANNDRLIRNLPNYSGFAVPQQAYMAWKATQPPAPKRNVVNLWGAYRVDPDNFVPAVTKVLDIVHSSGPKVRWVVKLANWNQTPMTNMSSKEIILPNYFESPNALGRTHQEILDAMTGAAMHEAGHAAYDRAETIIAAQKRIRISQQESTWASATCLNVVCDYNLERKVIERYPAFRHYFSECHRWSVRDTLPEIVKAVNADGAEDKLNVRIAVVVWEMLGPGDLELYGAVISPKLKWITNKCFSILKYAYTKGYLNREDGKLKTARAIYELIKVVNPVGAPPNLTQIPQPPQTGGQQPQPPIGGFPGQPSQGGQSQPTDDSGGDLDDLHDDQHESEDQDTNDGVQDEPSAGRSGSSTDADESEAGEPASGSAAGDPGEAQDSDQDDLGSEEEDEDTSGAEGQGDLDADGDGTGTDPGGDDQADLGADDEPGCDEPGGGFPYEHNEESSQDPSEDVEDPNDVPGDPGSNDSPPAGEATGDTLGQPGPSNRGGMQGSEKPVDPFDGKGDLEDDPTRRKNARKDALDDLEEENDGRDKIDETGERALNTDTNMDKDHREHAQKAANPPPIEERKIQRGSWEAGQFPAQHAARVRELSPVISRLKKILRFRNVDWGGRQTGRRSGALTRRHVARLSTLNDPKVFHKTQPDATPKVRIALLIDESESMRHIPNPGAQVPYIGAQNAATALTQALHGIRGVKLWSWGYAMMRDYRTGQGQVNVPCVRQYVDPYHQSTPSDIEASPMFGGTPTGEAMEHAAQVISKNASPDEKLVVFIITDGESGGHIDTGTVVRKWTGKITFVHIGIGNTVDKAIPFYVGPITDTAILPDLLSESVSEILR